MSPRGKGHSKRERSRQNGPRPRRQPASAEPPSGPGRGQVGSFPIVGIGASAGGLEALEQFLHQVPDKSGMAFVVIQHLDPTQKGMMVELLQRATSMKVVQAKDRQRVEPDGVYVIPPNKDMSILHGVLPALTTFDPRLLRSIDPGGHPVRVTVAPSLSSPSAVQRAACGALAA
ncbi:MAG: hypothetical protein HY903_25435, partial [Deltaproteobacteria bacterium]|nr:hypothetical protein [Deltaproteobacteria bacterium]